MGIFNPQVARNGGLTRTIQAKTYIVNQEYFLAGVGPSLGQPVMR